jgi:hypothetical protein
VGPERPAPRGENFKGISKPPQAQETICREAA